MAKNYNRLRKQFRYHNAGFGTKGGVMFYFSENPNLQIPYPYKRYWLMRMYWWWMGAIYLPKLKKYFAKSASKIRHELLSELYQYLYLLPKIVKEIKSRNAKANKPTPKEKTIIKHNLNK